MLHITTFHLAFPKIKQNINKNPSPVYAYIYLYVDATTIREPKEVELMNKTIGARILFWSIPGLIERRDITNTSQEITGPIKDALDEFQEITQSKIEV